MVCSSWVVPRFFLINSVVFAIAFCVVPAYSGDNSFPTLNPSLPKFSFETKFPEEVTAGGKVTGVIRMGISDGWHVYAPGADKKYRVFSVTDGGDKAVTPSYEYPDSKVATIADEKVKVYDGVVEVQTKLLFSEHIEKGNIVWKPVVMWQACSDNLCLPPSEKQLSIRFKVVK